MDLSLIELGLFVPTADIDQIADPICVAEIIEFTSSTPVSQIVLALKPLGILNVELGQDQGLDWAKALKDGVEYFLSRSSQCDESSNGGRLTSLTILVRRSCPFHDDHHRIENVLVPQVASTISDALNTNVIHRKTWWNTSTMQQEWNTTYLPSGNDCKNGQVALKYQESSMATNGRGNVARVTTVEACRPKWDGPLDFAFVVHPRTFDEKIKPFPELRRLKENFVEEFQMHCIVISWMEVEIGGQLLRGELLTIPFTPRELFERLPSARESLQRVVDYAASRKTRIVGLGALLPSITRQGRLLKDHGLTTGLTTGHGFTALAISQFVRNIEEATGVMGPVAVIGAAGSTGRAAVRCLIKDNPRRSLICIDLAQQLKMIPQPAGWTIPFITSPLTVQRSRKPRLWFALPMR